MERDLIIALFDAEEPPHFLGRRWDHSALSRTIAEDMAFAGVIVSDLIGHDLKLADLGVDIPGVDFLMPQVGKTVFVLGAESDAAFPGIVEEAAAETKGINVFPTLSRYIGAPSDHELSKAAGIPPSSSVVLRGATTTMRRMTSTGSTFKKLACITEFVATCIRKIDESPGGAGTEVPDTVDFEVRMIRAAVGPACPC